MLVSPEKDASKKRSEVFYVASFCKNLKHPLEYFVLGEDRFLEYRFIAISQNNNILTSISQSVELNAGALGNNRLPVKQQIGQDYFSSVLLPVLSTIL